MPRPPIRKNSRFKKTQLVAIVLLFTCVGCTRSSQVPSGVPGTTTPNDNTMARGDLEPPADYIDQITEWRATHEERLKSPTGWLALIDHHWLNDGPNTFGTDPDADLVLPTHLEGSPHGEFIVKGDTVRLETDNDTGVLVNGNPVTNIALTIDPVLPESDGKDTITTGDRLRLQLVRRANRFAVRVRDQESPAIREFRGKRWYPVNPEFRVVAEFTPYDPPKPITIVNVKGDLVPSKLSGKLEFKIRDQRITLDALVESPNELFLIFKDTTNGTTTYPPGRFVVTELPVDGRVVLDFNKAYNPPCAFSPHTLCPLPPEQNELDVAIEAGELKYE